MYLILKWKKNVINKYNDGEKKGKKTLACVIVSRPDHLGITKMRYFI